MSRRWAHRVRVVEALVWLLILWLALRLVPFRWLIALVDRRQSGAEIPPSEESLRRGWRVAAAVRRAARISPLPVRCLERALAAWAMLACRGLQGWLHLSAGIGAGNRVEGHAWLSLSRVTILGGGAPPGQVELARFG